jgi:hypothetical protein
LRHTDIEKSPCDLDFSSVLYVGRLLFRMLK